MEILSVLIWLLVLCIVFGLIWWVFTMLPLPEPIKKIASVILIVVMALVLIIFLLGLIGQAPQMRLR